ncbi:UNVERIFIED_CONTAM: Pectinesterase/pectinesterase inhibitor PPE8B [Sesamum radiatum]|uniref:pectinesterase n=1 Tax=Sesamum radiatum TaxID=300843 RepID=A0AAW2R3W8_SESRA
MAVVSSMKTLFFVMLLCFISGGNSELGDSECLKVPVSEFAGTLRSTLGVVGRVVSTVSKFSGAFSDFRLNNAVADCLDLMDFSADQFSWTLAASQNPNGKDNSTGNVIADMNTWLSGAMANQETCKEGFDGTNSAVKGLVSGSLDQLTSLVHNLLSMVKPNPTTPSKGGSGGRKLMTGGQFPDWLTSHDRKLLQASSGVVADAVVAADGTGNFSSIGEAVRAVPDYSSRSCPRTRIHSRDIAFENTAGPEKHQAVAFRSDSDLSVLYRCAFRGYQDTLYAHAMRQFYRECKITGTVDFMFGDATVVFQNCDILARKGLPNQKNTITAQGRKEQTERTGFSIQFCNISAESDNSNPTYLGRPWKLYSRTVIMQSYISNAIRPEGWLEWNGNFALNSLFYAEYMNYGPGAGLGGRVKWPGYHVLNDSAQATEFTVAEFIVGNKWLPATGVRYTAGLVM